MLNNLTELDAGTLIDIAEWLSRAYPDTVLNPEQLSDESYRLKIAAERGAQSVRDAFVFAAKRAKEQANGS